MSLKNKAVSGMIWTFIDQFATRGIGLIVQIVLARLLLPEDFGLVAMVAVFLAIGNALVDSGMTQSLIRTKETDQTDFSTVFFINVAVSILIYLIIFICAPLVSNFYSQPQLVPILRIYSLSIVIKSFSGVQITQLTKAMDFKTQTIVQAPSLVAGGIVGIIMAKFDYGVWAIVGMKLVQDFLSTIQYFIHTKWLPSFIFDKQKLAYHFDFGYKLTLSGLIGSIFDEAYNILIGKYFSPAILGYYNRAYTFQSLPATLFSRSLNRVTYPVFSELQDDNNALKSAYRRIMKQSMFLLTPIMALLICLAEPLFRFVLTEKWLPAVPIFQILCITGLLLPLKSYNLNVLRAKGFSGLILKLNFWKKLITIIGIFIFIQINFYALLWFQAINSFLMLVVNSYYAGRMINYPLISQLIDLIPTLIINLVLALILYFSFNNMNHQENDLPYVILFSLTFTFALAITAYILRIEELNFTTKMLKKIYDQIIKKFR